MKVKVTTFSVIYTVKNDQACKFYFSNISTEIVSILELCKVSFVLSFPFCSRDQEHSVNTILSFKGYIFLFFFLFPHYISPAVNVHTLFGVYALLRQINHINLGSKRAVLLLLINIMCSRSQTQGISLQMCFS